MEKRQLTMKLLNKTYGVCRLDKEASIPKWALESEFFSITKTEDELSVVCEMNTIPEEMICERNWRILKIVGPLDFALIGILASISSLLADSGISIFAVSTYDTDYILIKDKDVEQGVEALLQEEYLVEIDQ